ncbi:MAG: hypothetical protein U9Q81_15370 [Pseudomonadota bacterium]|nr:hypothetical protein [Pseudomonadota bacterium]
MKRYTIISLAAMASLGLGGFTTITPVQAGMFDMMSPGKWFGDDDDRYYGPGRYGYGYGPYGGGGPYGYGGGPYGYGGGPYGYGGGPYGWGGGPHGGGWGYPGGYGRGSTIVVNPQSGGDKSPKLPE